MTVRTLAAYAVAVVVLLVATIGVAANQTKGATTKKATVSVSGMACQEMCAPTLNRRLKQLPDVKAVTVSAEKANAVITFAGPSKVTDKVIQEAVARAGFTATKIAWQEGQ